MPQIKLTRSQFFSYVYYWKWDYPSILKGRYIGYKFLTLWYFQTIGNAGFSILSEISQTHNYNQLHNTANRIYQDSWQTKIWKYLELTFLFLGVIGVITIETASSKREFNPSLVSAEHSIYFSSLSDFARDAPWRD